MFYNVIYSCDVKLDFFSVSHDPSEIILICLIHAFLIIIIKKFFFFNIFVETMIHGQDTLMNRKFKRMPFIWNINLL